MQDERNAQDQQTQIRNYFKCMKEILYSATLPIRWFYNLDPVSKFTAVLSVIAILQAWAFMESERSFVYPTTANFTAGPLTADDRDRRLYIVLRNSGKGIAIIEEFNAAVTHNLPTKPIYVGQGTVTQQFTVPPIPSGIEIQHPLNFVIKWGESTSTEIKEGNRAFVLYGKFKYRDSFSWLFGESESGFCFVFDSLSSDSTKSVFRNCVEREYTYIK